MIILAVYSVSSRLGSSGRGGDAAACRSAPVTLPFLPEDNADRLAHCVLRLGRLEERDEDGLQPVPSVSDISIHSLGEIP